MTSTLKLSQKCHFLSISHFNQPEINILIEKSLSYLKVLKEKTPIPPLLREKTLLNCFFEASTRTQLSFTRAAKALGADVINFNHQTSSLKKGESFIDTLKTLNAMQPDWIVLRHTSPGAAYSAACHFKTPILNAGDGTYEHPSQALLDVVTILDQLQKNKTGKKEFSQLRILICGDILHSRVVRSQIKLFTLLGCELHLCAPPTLLPDSIDNWGVKIHTDLNSAITDCDIVILLRLQTERMQGRFFPSLKEYHHFWGLTPENIKKASPDVWVLHPGPVNRNVEISSRLLDHYPLLLVDQQVTAGVATRMGILDYLTTTRASLSQKGNF